MTLKFDAVERKIQGARPYQEDCCRFGVRGPAVWHEKPGLAVLADGMGGEGRGDLAAKVAVDTFIRTFERSALEPPKRLKPALQAANAALDELKRSDLALPPNMGCTLVAALIWNGRLYWISVGDSLLYLCERGELRRLNEDHSRAAEVDRALAAGEIDAQAARLDPRRHQLVSALVGRDIPLIDECVTPVRLSAGDLVLVASDGIQTLSDAELSRAIAEASGQGAEAVADALMRRVDRARDGDQDNATVMVVDVRHADEPLLDIAEPGPPLLEDDAELFSPEPQRHDAADGPPAAVERERHVPDGLREPDDRHAPHPGAEQGAGLDHLPGLRSLDRLDPLLISRAGTVALGVLVAAVTVFVMLQLFDRSPPRTVERLDETTTGSTRIAPTGGGQIRPASPEDTGDTPIPFPSPANSQNWDDG